MNDLQIFESPTFGRVRTLEMQGEPWFLGKDVAEALGYRNTVDAIQKHIDIEDKLTSQIAISGQNRNVVFINESGLYCLILSSKLPKAKQFKRWVTTDVLPAIRRTGKYVVPAAPEMEARKMELLRRLQFIRETQKQSIQDKKDEAAFLRKKLRKCEAETRTRKRHLEAVEGAFQSILNHPQMDIAAMGESIDELYEMSLAESTRQMPIFDEFVDAFAAPAEEESND